MSRSIILLLHLCLQTVNKGFAINPSCPCVRFTSTYGKERGTFSSPDYPRRPQTRLCLLYAFHAGPHQIVEIIFTDFDIYKEHLDCAQGDYLKVYSDDGTHGPGPPGINKYSSWSKIFCGNRADIPPPIYSHGSTTFLEYHTGDKTSNTTGFIGTYKFIDRRDFETDGVPVSDTLCDYIFSSQKNRPSTGKLYSPRYPSSYPTNLRCNYLFRARPHERVKLVFEESFLQNGDESCLSRADTIKVFDGRLTSAPVLALLCNEVIGYEILSTGPDLLVQLIANSEFPGQGFKAVYYFETEDNSTSVETDSKKLSFNDGVSGIGPAVSATTSSCHQIFRSDKSRSGKLESPLYPLAYPQKTLCNYEFLGRGRERVKIVFEDFSLLRVSDNIIDCESVDSLDAYLHVDGRLEKMASFCTNDIPKAIMSNGPKMSLGFRGLYSSRHSRGFKISYYFVDDFGITTGKQLLEFPCAFVYNNSHKREGSIISPNFPGLYPRDTECHYFFYGKKNYRVHIHFTHFDVEGVFPCEAISGSDYVQFSNNMVEIDSPRHCGQMKELQITSDNNFLRMTFRSNDRLDGSGFKADYIFLKDSEMHSIIMPKIMSKGSSFVTKDKTILLILIRLLLCVISN